MVVLDSSAALAIVKDSPEGQGFLGLMLPNEEVIAPELYYYEVANAVWKYENNGLWNSSEADYRLQSALALVDKFYPAKDFTFEVYKTAVRLGHPVYDLHYLVLAKAFGATLFTLDKKLIHFCRESSVNCIEEVAI